jgi:hypothetical protein
MLSKIFNTERGLNQRLDGVRFGVRLKLRLQFPAPRKGMRYEPSILGQTGSFWHK